MSPRAANTSDTAGLKCAPETGPKMVMITIRIAPIGMVLPRGAIRIAAGQPLRHDAGADHGRHQERGAEPLGQIAAAAAERASPIKRPRPATPRSPRGIPRHADRVELFLQRQLIERAQRQAHEDVYAVGQHPHGVGEGEADFSFGTLGGCRIGDAPMRRHRLARPLRAGFARCVVADREYKIELRRMWLENSSQLFERGPVTS